ncbi:hypothetical protein RFI_04061 [Reticulomyxa filosa]|uniref:Methyltransferase domain-containing protein n=1 Tax=Reticulomyxa filosa TaxID=46433 RepID=X6P4P1_RETFI|nr:hypothetical protein RFI_04061 [Reticulomyxa filosa]|eukprot:ETO33044.1 hypothetical protein RFI_04061 [Reticulomyxa filosa]
MSAKNPKHSKVKIEEQTITFGKTHINRLRRIDVLLTKQFSYLFDPYPLISPVVVDIGYGDSPITTLEMANAIHSQNKEVEVVGCEIDGKRVRFAKSFVENLVSSATMASTQQQFSRVNTNKMNFYQCGFEFLSHVSKKKNEEKSQQKVVLIRCMNVLRQFYDESNVKNIHQTLCQQLCDNGILCEGTSNKFGSYWCVNLLNSRCQCVAIVFGCNLKRDKGLKTDHFHPKNWQPFLPKNLIHRVNNEKGDDTIIYDFFTEWRQSYEEMKFSLHIYGNIRQHFIQTIQHFSSKTQTFKVERKLSLVKRGFIELMSKKSPDFTSICKIKCNIIDYPSKRQFPIEIIIVIN